MKSFFILFFVSLFSLINADMYDIIYDDYVPPKACIYGCANWNNLKKEGAGVLQNISDSLWKNKSNIALAKDNCAGPGNSVLGTSDFKVKLPGYAGPFCWCKNYEENFYPKWGYCTVKTHYPDQINLQISSRGSVVVNFITFCSFDGTNSSCIDNNTRPIIEYRENHSNQTRNVSGVTHYYSTPDMDNYINQPIRHYNMHFVRLENLKDNTKYVYRVHNGYDDGLWSKEIVFKTINYNDTTKFAVYGDMGVFKWNNMENLRKDFSDEDIDFTIQMGDHSYNIGQMDEHRGDNYMSAYSQVLKNRPWMPIVGNHEFYDNEYFHRYLNQTYGVIYNQSNNLFKNKDAHKSYSWNNFINNRSTATTPLGFFQSLGLTYSLGEKGSYPSGTSRFYSVDVGKAHLIALDTNIYYFESENIYRDAQLKWLENDLIQAHANRANVPWIIAMSHFPLYCTGCNDNYATSEWFAGSLSEYLGTFPRKENKKEYNEFLVKKNNFKNLLKSELKCYENNTNKKTVKNNNQISVEDFEKLFMKYKLDLYMAGHMHYYESLYPSFNFKMVQSNFTNPKAPVHITSGNGGPPSADPFHGNCPAVNCTKIFSTRKQSKEFSYGKVYIYNNTHLKFQQVLNNNNSILDEIMIIKS